MQEGEIFAFLGAYLAKKLPPVLHNPFFECVVCMAPWYGSVLYWLIWHKSIPECLVVIIGSMGLNFIISKMMDHG